MLDQILTLILEHPPSRRVASPTQDLDTEDEPLSRLQLVPWPHLSSLLAADKKQKAHQKRDRERVLFRQKGFGEEGGEGDAY